MKTINYKEETVYVKLPDGTEWLAEGWSHTNGKVILRDEKGNALKHQNSDGYSYEYEYDENSNETYFCDSDGTVRGKKRNSEVMNQIEVLEQELEELKRRVK